MLGQLLYLYFNDRKHAFEIVAEESKKGDVDSKCLLGFFISHGIGVSKDRRKGVEMILESQSSELIDSFSTDIGLYYNDLRKEKNQNQIKCANLAINWFEKAFNRNKTTATINNYGLCFLKGIGVEKDLEKAKEIFELGVKKGDANSMYHLAFILEKTNPEESLNLYKEAAYRNHKDAQIQYSYIIRNKDPIESKNFFKLSYRK